MRRTRLADKKLWYRLQRGWWWCLCHAVDNGLYSSLVLPKKPDPARHYQPHSEPLELGFASCQLAWIVQYRPEYTRFPSSCICIRALTSTGFQSHRIVFDNTFCGSYAGVASVWNSSVNSCLLQTGYPTCHAFVAAQPAAFQNS
jgi:hypothetical protein